MLEVVVKENDHGEGYRIGLTDGSGCTVFIFRTGSEASAAFCKECMEVGVRAGEQYRRLKEPWKLST